MRRLSPRYDAFVRRTPIVLLLLTLAGGVTAQDQRLVVAGVRQQLVDRGVALEGPCGAFEITVRVAWTLRAEGWGLIAKRPEQNGCTIAGGRYAVDALMTKDGRAIDLLINSETENRPAWNPTGIPPADLWRAPFDRDAVLIVPAPPSHHPALETPAVDLTPLVVGLDRILAQLEGIDGRLSAIEQEQKALRLEAARVARLAAKYLPRLVRPK